VLAQERRVGSTTGARSLLPSIAGPQTPPRSAGTHVDRTATIAHRAPPAAVQLATSQAG